MGLLSKKRLKRELGPKLIYSPFLRLVLFNTWFQLAFGAVMLAVIGIGLYLPKIWRVSPDGFLPEVKISWLDMTQNWALKRSARKAMAQSDFKAAAQAWEAAVAQNPADLLSLRGYLGNCLNLEKADRAVFRSAVSQMNWLLRLSRTNSADVELAARVCQKFHWNDVALYLLGAVENPLPPTAEAAYLKALFQSGRMNDFRQRYAAAAPRLHDPELDLYELALEASASSGSEAEAAEKRLGELSVSGERAVLATRLHMIACGQKRNLSGYSESLGTLARRNEDTVSDHANYWLLLASAGRKDQAVELARSFSRAPDSAAETVRLAESYFQLGMLEASREVLHRFAPSFYQSPEVWIAYAGVLEKQQNWGELREIALKIREDILSRDTLWGFAYYLEGRAELAEKRTSSAERAFEKAAESVYEIPPLGLAVAKDLARLEFAPLALKIYSGLEHSFQKDRAFWEAAFESAFAAQDAPAVLRTTRRLYEMSPEDVQACNRYAAALIVNRTDPEEVIRLTLQLISRYPNSLAAKMNHSFALLMNGRTAEARALLESFRTQELSASELNSYYLAQFELNFDLKQWDAAAAAGEKISRTALFPVQREWLREKHRQMPPRQMAKAR